MKEGWICPKCGRVWGPDIWGCQDCNKTPVKQAKMPARTSISGIGQVMDGCVLYVGI